MKRLVCLACMLTCMVLLIVGSGCDSSKDPVSNGTNDSLNATFQFVDSIVGEDMFSDFNSALDMSLSLLDEVEGMGSAPSKSTPLAALGDGPGEVVITVVESCEFTPELWFIFVFEGMIIDGYDTVDISGIDSIQLLNDGVPLAMELIPFGFNGVKVRAHIQGATNNGTTLSSHRRVDFEVDVVETDSIATISGTADDTISVTEVSDEHQCLLGVTSNMAITDLQLLLLQDESGEDCPLGGSIAVEVTFDLECLHAGTGGLQELDIEGTWSVTAVVNDNGTITVTISDGTTTITTTETLDCGPWA